MAGYADLHVHTNYSDGLLSPEEVIGKALEAGLKAISITDHDCTDGIDPAIEAASGNDIEVIPGVEISSVIGQSEIHILGYFIDHHHPVLSEMLEGMKASRVGRMRKMVDLLNGKGFPLDAETVLESAPSGTVGRLHLARLMKQEGFVRSLREAFDNYIGNGRPCHVAHERLEHTRAIEVIRSAGGVPVLAHPGTCGGERHLEELVKEGLRGIEVYHSDHGVLDEEKYAGLASKHGLVVSGGSDCHGAAIKGEILIGKFCVTEEIVDVLRKEAGRIRGSQK